MRESPIYTGKPIQIVDPASFGAPVRNSIPHYADLGCSFSPSCLSCPLPVCRDDMGPKQAASLERELAITKLLAAGHSIDACAAALGVTRRSAYRAKAGKIMRRLGLTAEGKEAQP